MVLWCKANGQICQKLVQLIWILKDGSHVWERWEWDRTNHNGSKKCQEGLAAKTYCSYDPLESWSPLPTPKTKCIHVDAACLWKMWNSKTHRWEGAREPFVPGPKMGVNAVAAWLNHLGNGSFSMSDTLNWLLESWYNIYNKSFLRAIATLAHYSDIVFDIPFGSINAIYIYIDI